MRFPPGSSSSRSRAMLQALREGSQQLIE
jgi:hypothetical protein